MLCFVTLRQDVKTTVSGIRHVDLQRSHALSRFQSVAEDQDFISNSVDFRNPLRFIGPNSWIGRTRLRPGVSWNFVVGCAWDSSHITTLRLVALFRRRQPRL